MTRKKTKYKAGKVVKGGHLPISLKVKNSVVANGMSYLNAIKFGGYDRDVGLNLILYLTAFKNAVGRHSPEALQMILEMFQVINRVKDRFDSTGKWGFTGDERNIFLDYLPAVIDFMSSLNRGELESGRGEAHSRLTGAIAENLARRDSVQSTAPQD